jgi:hypothetical protein
LVSERPVIAVPKMSETAKWLSWQRFIARSNKWRLPPVIGALVVVKKNSPADVSALFEFESASLHPSALATKDGRSRTGWPR